VPKPSEERILAAGRAAVQYMHGLGITAWLDAEASKAILATYRRLAESGELNSHVAALPVTPRDIPPSTGKTAHVILEQVAVILRQVFSNCPKYAHNSQLAYAASAASASVSRSPLMTLRPPEPTSY
jgi:predicted amidohydrolase YtcJ